MMMADSFISEAYDIRHTHTVCPRSSTAHLRREVIKFLHCQGPVLSSVLVCRSKVQAEY